MARKKKWLISLYTLNRQLEEQRHSSLYNYGAKKKQNLGKPPQPQEQLGTLGEGQTSKAILLSITIEILQAPKVLHKLHSSYMYCYPIIYPKTNSLHISIFTLPFFFLSFSFRGFISDRHWKREPDPWHQGMYFLFSTL